jgi:hypothetical protein
MTTLRDSICLLPVLLSLGALGEPLMPPENFIPQASEASLLNAEELRRIDIYRKDTNSYRSAKLFRANLDALRSDIVDVEVEGKSRRYFAWERFAVTQDPKTQQITRHTADYVRADGYLWTGSTTLPARGRPTAQFSWGGPNDPMLSGQFVVDGVMYTINTVGRFHVLLVDAHPLSAIPGTEPQYVCRDSTGEIEMRPTPVPRCDRPQRLVDRFGDPGPILPATLTKEEAEPFERLHPKLRVSPLHCGSNEVTYCEGMVRISCNAGADWPVNYYDNSTAERLGTCGFWVRDPTCMPQRWKACAVKNGVRHIGEEPDPAR